MKTHRELRKSLGTRTSRRHGTKTGEAERPNKKLKKLIEQQRETEKA